MVQAPLFIKTGLKKPDMINVWDNYFGGKIIGQMLAGTPAKLLEKAEFNGATWYRIDDGRIKGWVSGSFIRKIKYSVS